MGGKLGFRVLVFRAFSVLEFSDLGPLGLGIVAWGFEITLYSPSPPSTLIKKGLSPRDFTVTAHKTKTLNPKP